MASGLIIRCAGFYAVAPFPQVGKESVGWPMAVKMTRKRRVLLVCFTHE